MTDIDQRARRLAEQICNGRFLADPDVTGRRWNSSQKIAAAIKSALRAERDAALEEAAKIVVDKDAPYIDFDEVFFCAVDADMAYQEGYERGRDAVLAAIRALKSQPPTEKDSLP
jgi:hypothetical protein